MFEPMLIEGEKRIPLSQCNQEQLHRLRQQVMEKMGSVSNYSTGSIYSQLAQYVEAIDKRMDEIEMGMVDKKKLNKDGKKPFNGLKIMKDLDD